ncbi:MAG: FecR domain-containing protein [Pseudomonadota bacterium]
MTMKRANESLLRAASDRFVRLAEDPEDAGLIAEIEQWRARSGEHEQAWLEVCRTWHGLIAVSETTEVGPRALRDMGERPFGGRSGGRAVDRRPAPRRRTRRVGTLAAAAMTVAMLWWVASDGPLRLNADHATASAETNEVGLPDGSRAHLGAQSLLRVGFSERARTVELLSGEAFFEVTPDPERPFRVAAGDLDVVAIGTAFNVRITSDGVETSVAEGVVRVDGAGLPAEAETLSAGQRLTVSAAGGSAEPEAIPPTDVALWRGERLVVSDRRVGDVVADLQRYLGGSVIFTDPEVAQKRVSGTYNLAEPDRALAAVLAPFDTGHLRITPFLTVIYPR